MGENSTRKSWRQQVALFLGSQAISLFGSSLVQFAMMWFITMETQSGRMMTIAIVVGFVPVFVLAPFAGVWADRHNRRYLIAGADMLVAVATVVVLVAFLLGHRSLTVIFLVMAARAVGTGIQTPAVGALLPQLVPEKHLTQVNGYNAAIQAFVGLASPMLAGALMMFSSMPVIFAIDLVTAVIATVILLTLVKVGTPSDPALLTETSDTDGQADDRTVAQAQKVAAEAAAVEGAARKRSGGTGYFAELRNGLDYVGTHPLLLRFFAFLAISYVLIAPGAFLSPLQVSRSFGNDVWRLSAIEIAFAVGMVAGGLLIAWWQGFRNPIRTIGFSVMAGGVGLVGLGVAPWFWLYIVIMALIGIIVPMMNAPANALLQRVVNPLQMGRVFGVMSMIATSTMPLAMLVFGPIADRVGLELMMVVTGLFEAVLGLVMMRDRTLLAAAAPTSP